MSSGSIFDNTNNIGFVKTKTLFFFPNNSKNINSSDPLTWLNFDRSFEDKTYHVIVPQNIRLLPKDKKNRSLGKGHQKKKHVKHKLKKYIQKLLKGKKKKHKFFKKKFIHIFMGILAAKSLLVLIVLKTIALISAKVLIMGFFSTLMSTIVSLKGMFGHSYFGHRNRKDDGNTRLEIVHIPPKDDGYYGRPYRRKDLQAIRLDKSKQ